MYIRIRSFSLLFTILFSFQTNLGLACTSFSISQSSTHIVGKSYDWDQDHGHVLINKRNLEKVALVTEPDIEPAKWVSQYGNLTFNQHGRDFPLGGINEEGLVVEIMWLNQTEYPQNDPRPAVNELQWIQYQLDNFSKTEEVVTNAKEIQIVSMVAPVHYLVCDSSRECATFEYLEGKLVIHSEDDFPFSVLTNSTYADSISFLKKHIGFGGSLPLPSGIESLTRFVTMAKQVKDYPVSPEPKPVQYAFDALEKVKFPSATQFQIVYESTKLQVHFQTKISPQRKKIDFTQFDLDCQNPAQGIDMNSNISGDITKKFSTFTQDDNKNLAEIGLAPFKGDLPEGAAELIAKYPDSFRCVE